MKLKSKQRSKSCSRTLKKQELRLQISPFNFGSVVTQNTSSLNQFYQKNKTALSLTTRSSLPTAVNDKTKASILVVLIFRKYSDEVGVHRAKIKKPP
jgi:hypothetical protein